MTHTHTSTGGHHKKSFFKKPLFHLLLTLFFIIVSFLLVAFLQKIQDTRERAAPIDPGIGVTSVSLSISGNNIVPEGSQVTFQSHVSYPIGGIEYKVEIWRNGAYHATMNSTGNDNYSYTFSNPQASTDSYVAKLFTLPETGGQVLAATSGTQTLYTYRPSATQITITSPQPNATITNGTVTLSATASNPNIPGNSLKLKFYTKIDGGSTVQTGGEYPATSASYTWNSVPGGTYSLWASAFVNSSFIYSTPETSPIRFTVRDTVGPTVSMVLPEANTNVTNPVHLKADANDSSGVSKVEFILNDTNNTVLYTDTQAPFEGDATVNVPVGTGRSVYAKAIDTHDNLTTSSLRFFNVTGSTDTTGPTISNVIPLANASIPTTTVPFSANVADTGSGVSSVSFFIDGTSYTASPETSGSSRYVLERTFSAGTTHQFYIVARDTAGNTSRYPQTEGTTQQFYITSGGARVIMNQPTGNLTVNQSVGLSATIENVNNLYSVQFIEVGNTTPLCTDNNGTVPHGCSWTPVTGRTYQVQAKALIPGGFISSDALPITISGTGGPGDTTAPTVSITNPSNNATNVASPVTVRATATDNVGVSSVKFYKVGESTEFCTASPVSGQANTYECSPYAGFSEGTTNTIVAKAKDAANNEGTSSQITFTMAGTVTTSISMKSPADGAQYDPPANITLQANVTALPSGQKVCYYTKPFGGNTETSPGSSNNAGNSYQVAWNSVPAGKYEIRAEIKSICTTVSYTAKSDIVTITVGAASVTITDPRPNQRTISLGSYLTIQANAYAIESGRTVETVELWKQWTNEPLTKLGNMEFSSSNSYYYLTRATRTGTVQLIAKVKLNGSTIYNAESEPITLTVVEPTEAPPATESPAPPATNTPAPTNTIAPGNIAINFSLLLHGIGKAGDNVTPGRGGNMSPIRSQRTIKFEVYDGSNQLVTTKEGTVTFNSTDGNFTGKIDAGTLTPGSYYLKVWGQQYLKKRILGVQVPSGSNEVNAQASLVTGDANEDNKLNVLDYNMLLDCYSDLTDPKNCSDENKKKMTDLTDDGKVNLFDVNLFLRELSTQDGD